MRAGSRFYAFVGRDAQYLLLIAALPILGYQFGSGTQVEQFPIIGRLSDPDFLPGDFYVNSAAGFGPRYYYSVLVSWLTEAAPLPVVIFVLTFATTFALAAVSYHAARRHLRANRIAAALAALLVVANGSFSLGLAGFLRFDSYQPASLAIPLALFGFSSLIAGMRWPAALLFSLSALIHPLIGVEVAAISYGACGLAEIVRQRSPIGAAPALLRYVPSGIVLCGVILLAWALPSLGQPTIPDAEYFHIVAVFRAPHHYLASAFPLLHYLTATLFAAACGYFVLGYVRKNGFHFESVALAFAALIVIGMCAASAVLGDILANRAFMTAQIFRMLMVLKWVGFLFFAESASTWIKKGDALHWVAAAAPMVVTGDAQPIIMVAAIIAVEAATRLRSGVAGLNLSAALLLLFGIVIAAKAGAHKEMVRAGVGAACVWPFFGLRFDKPLFRASAAALVAILIIVGWANRDLHVIDLDAFRPTYSWGDLEGSDADIARWASSNTPVNAIWLTPPAFENFRLIAQRAVVVDFTSFPWGDLAIREWKARMTALYGEVEGGGFSAQRALDRNYRDIDSAQLRRAGRRFGAEYAVLYTETPWPGRALYENADYKAVTLVD